MNKIIFGSNSELGYTTLSNNFIDKHMPNADGFYVKVYVYLLRCFSGNISISISDIADIFETSESDINRAILFWEKQHLLAIKRDEANNIFSIDFTDSDNTHTNSSKIIGTNPNHHLENLVSSTSNNPPLADSIANDIPHTTNQTSDSQILNDSLVTIEDLINDTMFMESKNLIETIIGRAISSIEMNLITNLYTKYHFEPELLVHLFEYCMENNYSNTSAIEKIGMNWADNGIQSIKQAKEYGITRTDVYRNVIKAFGIKNRNLGTEELEYLDTWIHDYSFSSEIICKACSKTILKINTPSFPYAHKILTGWFTNNVQTLDDIEKLDTLEKQKDAKITSPVKNFTKKPASSSTSSNFNFEQRTYSDEDYQSLEMRAFEKYSAQ